MCQSGNGFKDIQIMQTDSERTISVGSEIFVDETLFQIDGQYYWLWIVYEPNLNVCLIMDLSHERTIFVCYQFFKQLRDRYGGRKPTIFTDGAR
jgi:transposase-like protein